MTPVDDLFGLRTRVLPPRARSIEFVPAYAAPLHVIAADPVINPSAGPDQWWFHWERIPVPTGVPSVDLKPGEDPTESMVRWAVENSPYPLTFAGALESFVNLRGSGEMEALAVNAGTYLKIWGTLDLCTHLLPSGHCYSDDAFSGWAPLSAFGFYTDLFQDLVLAGQEGLDSPRKGFKFGSERYRSAQLIVRRWVGGDDLPTTLRGLVAQALTAVVHWSETRDWVRWGQDTPGPTFEPISISATIGALVSDTVSLLASGRRLLLCHGCGYLVDMRRRPRMTIAGRRTWCDRCRAAGKHKRESERRQLLDKSPGATAPPGKPPSEPGGRRGRKAVR